MRLFYTIRKTESQKIELHVEDETVWLNIKELAELFQTTRQNIANILKIYSMTENYENMVCNYKLHTTEYLRCDFNKNSNKKIGLLQLGYDFGNRVQECVPFVAYNSETMPQRY